MVNHCANPNCGKPLRYLREGRIFVFETQNNDGEGSVRRMEHFWLCGACSQIFRLEKTRDGVQAVMKHAVSASFVHPLAS
jgi:hypothetical protein